MAAPTHPHDFKLNRSLLNSKFEGYRFNPLPQDNLTRRHGLQYKPSQTNTSASRSLQPMSFQEVQSRITHNHLAVRPGSALGVYVDAEYRVIGVTVEPTALQPTFYIIAELPQSVQSSDTHDSRRAEYPSSAFANPNTLLVADGHGTLYSFLLSEDQTSAKLLGSYELRPDSAAQPLPFRIHVVQQISPDFAIVILSSRSYAVKPHDPKSRAPVEFDLWGVEVPLTSATNEEAQILNCVWQRTGREVPVYSAYHDSPPSFHIFGGSPYTEPENSTAKPHTPAPDEIAPIPRAGENLDAEMVPKPPPYSWTQTSDSVTVAFPLPSTTPKSAIKVAFTQKSLNLLISDASQEFNSSPLPLPRYIARVFWDGIQSSTSLWTWEKTGEHGFGLLTLHLDKQHEGTRWSQVFAPHQTPSGEPEPEVAETLDPSELYNIREALEKYTSSLSDDGSGLGLGKGVPSLGKGEIDDELDSSVGRETFLTRVPVSTPQIQNGTDTKDQPPPVTLLSTPLQGLSKPGDSPSLIAKNDIDGLFYTLTAPSRPIEGDESIWTHASTFPALSFVLASKQDVRYTHHISDRVVLAFESGSRGLGFNIYLYQATPTRSAQWAKQSVIRVGDAATGPLLGVGALTLDVEGGKKVVILCLCENEIIVVQDIPISGS
ncbi:hypothetical protein BJ322DRAFT_142228 [Thelephora terrestris]|uniref:NudC domain-containing protein 1 n=1 Tax=Thelephora terrestris TaxID=56493 RepID=A0A9P6L4R5_9AGAM|nr:hypothetical protein BJ322DRAFT_142228 [Thelephora terrestris]